jgi:hypothetical protein
MVSPSFRFGSFHYIVLCSYLLNHFNNLQEYSRDQRLPFFKLKFVADELCNNRRIKSFSDMYCIFRSIGGNVRVGYDSKYGNIVWSIQDVKCSRKKNRLNGCSGTIYSSVGPIADVGPRSEHG